MDIGSIWSSITGAFKPAPSTVATEPQPFDYEAYAIEKPGFLGSLWDGFRATASGVYADVKELAPDVMDVYKTIQQIKRPVDNTALVIRETPRADIPRQDFAMSTPYQRSTSGAQPASSLIPGGLSMPLLLVGAGLVFFMLKKR